MRKLERSDTGIDYVKLLAEHARKKGIAEYTGEAIKEFGDDVERRLSETAQAEHRLRGLRAESLFLAVVAGIGKVALIKAEDSGEVFFTGDELLVPDFRVVPLEGPQLLVEVKSVRMEGTFKVKLKLSDSYVQKLRNYASRTGVELRFAIFWEELGQWTLNRLEAFSEGAAGEKQWSIGFLRALTTNEMGSLGDCFVATTAPLRFRVLLDPEKSEPMPPGALGTFTLVLAGVQLLSQDRTLSGLAAQIAWKLLWYGRWTEVHQDSRHEGDKLLWVDHIFAPLEWDEEEHDPNEMTIVGALSEMISAAYLRGAAHTIHTTATDGVLEPGYMGNFIPENFAKMDLDVHLWVLHMSPNFDCEIADEPRGDTS
jgi:hypothetical protein